MDKNESRAEIGGEKVVGYYIDPNAVKGTPFDQGDEISADKDKSCAVGNCDKCKCPPVKPRNIAFGDEEIGTIAAARVSDRQGDKAEITAESLWQPEWTECVAGPGIPGAEKYGLNNYLEPDGQSIRHPKNCNSMFHHLAREFVYQENAESIDRLVEETESVLKLKLKEMKGSKLTDGLEMFWVSYLDRVAQLLHDLKYDAEIKTRHVQSIAWRGCAGFTREKRGLPK